MTESTPFQATCDRDGCDELAWWTATRNEGSNTEDRILYRTQCPACDREPAEIPRQDGISKSGEAFKSSASQSIGASLSDWRDRVWGRRTA